MERTRAVTRSRNRFYLDKANAKVFGVCSGIADYTGLDVFWVRFGAIMLTLLGFGTVILAYLVAALLANPKPTELTGPSHGSSHAADMRQRDDGLRDFDRRMADIDRFTRQQNTRLAAEIDQLR